MSKSDARANFAREKSFWPDNSTKFVGGQSMEGMTWAMPLREFTPEEIHSARKTIEEYTGDVDELRELLHMLGLAGDLQINAFVVTSQ